MAQGQDFHWRCETFSPLTLFEGAGACWDVGRDPWARSHGLDWKKGQYT